MFFLCEYVGWQWRNFVYNSFLSHVGAPCDVCCDGVMSNSSMLAHCCVWNYTSVEIHSLRIVALEFSDFIIVYSDKVYLQHGGVVLCSVLLRRCTCYNICHCHCRWLIQAADYLAIGIHELASISERRIERLINPGKYCSYLAVKP